MLLLHFIEYRLDQPNSKHTKIAVNSAIQYFEGCCQIEQKSFLNGQHFQTLQISDIWFNENA